jgi:NADPH:quinone reductase-like Zn-dependent oxidoreductase
MRLVKRILAGIFGLVALAAVSLAIAVSYDSPCREPDPIPADAQRMKAVVSRCYGSPEVLKIEEVAKPAPKANELLVKVHAASVNPLDWHYMRGKPYIMRMSSGIGSPKDIRSGVDFAGTVEAVGEDVTRFKVGDEVFGGRGGALAQYVTVREDRAVVHKPANVTFEQAAAVPIAGVTALQALRDIGHIKAGQKVLINGASGGVGTFAVQIAKSLGAEVTGVCSTRNVELVQSLGADRVIDYTKQNFTEGSERYDVIVDNVGNHPLRDARRALKPGGIVVMVGGKSDDPWLGPMWQPIKAAFLEPTVDEKFVMFFAELNQGDLGVLAGLMQSGKVTSVIDSRHALVDTPSAVAYLEQGRARGKVIVTID